MAGSRVLISGYYGFANFGDEAALAILAGALQDRGLQVTGLTYDGIPSQQAPELTVADKRNFSERWSAVKGADCVVIGPGGILKRSANASFFSLGAVALRDALVAQAHGVPYLLYSVSASSSFTRRDRLLVRAILKRASWIGARDPLSVETLSAMGLDQVELVRDSIEAYASTVSLAPPARPGGGHGVLAVAPSASDQAFWESDQHYIDELDAVLSHHDQPMVGIVCQSGPNGDLPIIEALVASGHTFRQVHDWSLLSAEQAAATLDDVSSMVASRFHAGILGRARAIPVTPFGHDSKLDTFLESRDHAVGDDGIAGFVSHVESAISDRRPVPFATALWSKTMFLACLFGHYSYVALTRFRRTVSNRS